MKKILFLFLLIPVMAQAQKPVQLPVNYFDGAAIISTGDTIPYTWARGIATPPGRLEVRGYPQISYPSLRVPDCEAWETFSAWEVKNSNIIMCNHAWAYAEWNEVNTLDLFTTLEMPPPCGRTRHENEARICRTCLRHETRVRMHGMKEVERKSEFQTLLEKINDR